jgi:hypothetical protein
MEDELKNTVNFTEHVFDGSGNNIMNSVQYTAMSIVPLLLVNNFLETQMPIYTMSTTPVSMVIEIAVHLIVLLIVLYFVDRVVRFFPLASGENYGEVSFETIGLLLVLLVVNSTNSNLGKKVTHMTRHVRERFDLKQNGKEEEETKKPKDKPPHPQQPPQPAPPTPPAAPTTSSPPHKTYEGGIKEKMEDFVPSSSAEGFAIGGGNYSLF